MKAKKPISKRKSTRLQQGIKKKVAAHNRKERKQSKKDVTWKSKVKKDPGIPNSFPYKNRILEQIEENRLKEAEEKERRREAQRAAAKAAGETFTGLDDDDSMAVEESNSNRLSALLASAQQAAKEYDGEEDEEEDDDDEDMEVDDSDGESEDEGQEIEITEGENVFEGSRKAFDKLYKQVVDDADVVLYVLDARNPEGTRSRQVERTVLANPSKRLIFVLNKIDLVPSDVLKKWIKYLELAFPTIPLAASSAAPNATTFEHKGLTQVATSTILLQALKKYASESQLKRSISVGVIGYPNVGKSSVINSLTARHGSTNRACPVGAQAGVTTVVRKVKVDNKLSILDSPGIVFPSSESSKKANPVEEKARLILLNAVPPKQIDDPRPAVSLLLKRLSKNDDLMTRLKKYYDLPPIVTSPHDKFVTSFLVEIARKKGRLGRGGVPDLDSSATAVITDWRDGRIAGWALPPVLKSSSSEAPTGSVDASSGAAIEQNQTVIVTEWAKEFSLDGLWDGQFDE
ncbi:RNA-binding GTPase NUG1 [Sugiyamaella lignohabitans]|uniref:RNA-binding GTPase NUG1 n=1 Tax=Sugiyamaella lignohabitans TaxID=796027 RepID=A0A167FJD7_9ASCO|nr:RNA-binding GTPase NUG1 [Sugiyamaella lignohabitans]ANB15376.1 RNA-binding GTPase NUG1 [Sugiyamaella lignohabitans]